VCTPHTTSHLGLSRAELDAAGIRPGTIRFSFGIEPAAELVADLSAALAASTPSGAAAPIESATYGHTGDEHA
jgi:cystathionine beta-lyase/cystathionine gamma-synthase